MPLIDELLLKGPQCKTAKELYIKESPRHMIGTTPGTKRTIRSKFDGNEDYLLTGTFQDGRLFCVCDAHFGARSAESCIHNLVGFCQDIKSNPVRSMFYAHYELDSIIKEECLKHESQSATTCITGYHINGRLSWINSGDSSLFIIRKGKILRLNKRTPPLFVGEFLPPIENASEEFHFPSVFFKHKLSVQYFHLILSTLCSMANSNSLTAEILEKHLSKLQSETGVRFQGSISSLIQPWHDVHTMSYKTIPEWGQFNTQDDDIILAVTDGIYEADDPVDKLLELIQKTPRDLKEAGRSILQHTLDIGGNDNASLYMASIS